MAEFVTVMNEFARMCHNTACIKCELYDPDDYVNCACRANPEEAEKIIMDWAAKHPVETMRDRFFKIFSGAPKDDKGTPTICPHHIGWEDDAVLCETRKCQECWSRPYIKEEE